MDCFCDYEPAQVYRSRVVTARKEHRCEECSRRIRIGERHEYVFGVWGGTSGQARTCSHCLDIRTFVNNSVPCFCWAHGNMLEDAQEAVREAYWRAREEVRGLWFGYGRLVVNARRAREMGRDNPVRT